MCVCVCVCIFHIFGRRTDRERIHSFTDRSEFECKQKTSKSSKLSHEPTQASNATVCVFTKESSGKGESVRQYKARD